ncbi:MAG: hypothetical protein IPK76_11490 [Lewinellaceae bacterium]|nr:hypothetical protein [Lewinellaceae bacterium]
MDGAHFGIRGYSLVLSRDRSIFNLKDSGLLPVALTHTPKNGWTGAKETIDSAGICIGERSDRLFRRISRFWRLLGPVQVISGPDLANSTIEPHEFMDFLTGRLSRQFLESEEEINRKVAYLDDQPSADGNYGINDFYAYNSSWKSVLAALVETTDRIIMDIRSFSPGHQGCIHEIKELFRRISIKKVLFIIDRNTDWQFMEKTFQEACSEIQKGEINDIPDGGLLIINIYRLEGEDYSVGELLESIESPEIIVSH